MGGAITRLTTKKSASPPSPPANPAETAAATKIQAISRGKDTRKVDKAIKELFEQVDKNADGKATRREMLATLGKNDDCDDLRKQLGLPNPKAGGKSAVWAFKTAFDESFKRMDTDGDGVVSVGEFATFLSEYKTSASEAAAKDKAAVAEAPAAEAEEKEKADEAAEGKEDKKPVEEAFQVAVEPAKPADEPAKPAVEPAARPAVFSPSKLPPLDNSSTTAATADGRISPTSVADPATAAA